MENVESDGSLKKKYFWWYFWRNNREQGWNAKQKKKLKVVINIENFFPFPIYLP